MNGRSLAERYEFWMNMNSQSYDYIYSGCSVLSISPGSWPGSNKEMNANILLH
jgi:hypothetical protein